MAWHRWWSARSSPEQFELYTRLSLYFLLLFEPLAPFLFVAGVPDGWDPPGTAYLVLVLLHAGLGVGMIRAGLDSYLGRRPPGRWLPTAYGVVTAAAVAGSVVAFDFADTSLAAGYWAAVVPLGYAVAVASPWLRVHLLMLLCVGVIAVLVVIALATGQPGGIVAAVPFPATLSMVGAVLSYRVSVVMLGNVWALDRARGVAGDLAVAEERLRFARDLHDVLGRNLSVIAVTSQLAARLAELQRPGAVEEMQKVRAVAEESLREVRAVVRGYRTADVAAELEGARSVLGSAGITTDTAYDAGDLPAHVHQALGWVVREAATNVLRHSTADHCRITVAGDADAVTVEVWNDGATGGRAGGGTGLVGLEERLRAVGGTVRTAYADGTFTLTASVPLAVGVTP